MSEHLPPSSRRLRRMASDYEESFSEARAEQLAARALARAHAEEARPRRRMAVLVGAASVLFVLVGLGYGSAKSLPGDSLYGVSRTYEHFGQLVGVVDPVQERLYEVIALAERGERDLAAQTASEALQELDRRRGMTVSFPQTVATTPPSTPPTTFPTTPPTTAPDNQGTAPAVTPEDTTTTTVKPSITVDANEEDAEDDRIQTLKLAAELLLDRVKENGEELDDAAANLAVAVSALTTEEDTTTVAADESADSTTSSTSSTSTTQPKRNGPTSTTSTTTPGSTTSSTSTTIPGEETPGEDDDSGSEEDGPGPIILPPEF